MKDGKGYWFLKGVQYLKEEFLKKTQPIRELTVQEISERLGYEVKIITNS